MEHELAAYLAIFGMGGVTYLTRIGGPLLLARVSLSPRLDAWLACIPGAVIMSIVAPAVFGSGPSELAAGGVTLLAAWRTRSLPLAMLAGVAAVIACRRVWGQM